MTSIPSSTTRRGLLAALGLAAAAVAAPALAAGELPGQGVVVQPLKSTIAEETFQTEIVMKALEKLGYDVQPIKEVDYPAAHLAIASGDGTFLADHWDPLHNDYYKNAGGDAKLWRDNAYSTGALQGYLIDKKTADQYHITNIEQFKDPKIAQLLQRLHHDLGLEGFLGDGALERLNLDALAGQRARGQRGGRCHGRGQAEGGQQAAAGGG